MSNLDFRHLLMLYLCVILKFEKEIQIVSTVKIEEAEHRYNCHKVICGIKRIFTNTWRGDI